MQKHRRSLCRISRLSPVIASLEANSRADDGVILWAAFAQLGGGPGKICAKPARFNDTNKTDKDTARSCAVMAYRAMVGAISMARAVSDKALSREILKTVAQRLKPGTTREQ